MALPAEPREATETFEVKLNPVRKTGRFVKATGSLESTGTTIGKGVETQIGMFNYENGIIAFIDDQGVIWVGIKTDEAINILQKAGYTAGPIAVPHSDNGGLWIREKLAEDNTEIATQSEELRERVNLLLRAQVEKTLKTLIHLREDYVEEIPKEKVGGTFHTHKCQKNWVQGVVGWIERAIKHFREANLNLEEIKELETFLGEITSNKFKGKEKTTEQDISKANQALDLATYLIVTHL